MYDNELSDFEVVVSVESLTTNDVKLEFVDTCSVYNVASVTEFHDNVGVTD